MLLSMACDSAPNTPTPPPSGGGPGQLNRPFIASADVNPIYIGYGPKVTPESPPQAFFTWGVTVEATGTLRGTMQRVDARLRDRATGLALGNATHAGPFLNIRDPRIANQVVDPLLETGRQTFTAHQQDLGFVGNPATLELEVTIKDSTGTNWTVVTTALCEADRLFINSTRREQSE
jgi:hypothetical protein